MDDIKLMEALSEVEEETVLALIQELKMDQIPRLTLYNKLDRVDHFVPTLNPSRQFSAHSPSAKEDLKAIIIEGLKELWEPFELHLSRLAFLVGFCPLKRVPGTCDPGRCSRPEQSPDQSIHS